jgi:hypothetical protein
VRVAGRRFRFPDDLFPGVDAEGGAAVPAEVAELDYRALNASGRGHTEHHHHHGGQEEQSGCHRRFPLSRAHQYAEQLSRRNSRLANIAFKRAIDIRDR